MALLCDKYRPNMLTKLDYHTQQSNWLMRLVDGNDFPHLFICGPSGAGKKTRVECILREIYGGSVEKQRIESQTFTTPSNRKIEIRTIASNYHIEVNPSDVGIYDRVVIQDMIKEIAETNTLANDRVPFKVVVISEADRLTKEAQHALRRTMEKYVATCRIILVGESSNRIIPAIKSRVLLLRVSAPSEEEMERILLQVARREGFYIKKEQTSEIALKSERNLRRALLMEELIKLDENNKIVLPNWLNYLNDTAKIILQSQTMNKLREVRGRLMELLVHLIPAEIIMRQLLKQIVLSIDPKLKGRVIHVSAFYEHQMRQGNKPLFHLEAFVAKVMSIYKTFLEEQIIFDDDDDLMELE